MSLCVASLFLLFFSSRRRHTRCYRDWSSDVCSSDLRSSSRSTRASWCGGSWPRRDGGVSRSEERRVGEEGRSRWSPDHLKKKTKNKDKRRVLRPDSHSSQPSERDDRTR